MMNLDDEFLGTVVSDLALDRAFVRGSKNQIKNCWHFCTDGNSVDRMFYDNEDFIAGMNRVYITLPDNNKVLVLAFSLMDTHIHFVLYGSYYECGAFIHNYIAETSRYISKRYGERKKFVRLPVHCQSVTDDFYLKIVICYVIKNAPVGGIPYNGWDYPWSSAPLYFRQDGCWSSPMWMTKLCEASNDAMNINSNNFTSKRLNPGSLNSRSLNSESLNSKSLNSESLNSNSFNSKNIDIENVNDNQRIVNDNRRIVYDNQGTFTENMSQLSVRKRRRLFNTKKLDSKNVFLIGNLIFPGEYVPYGLVERIFKTHRSFLFFMNIAKEEDVESVERIISMMTIPIQELRQHRDDMCQELFGTSSIRILDMTQRVRLAKGLREKYNCSLKQIARVCCVAYDELLKILR